MEKKSTTQQNKTLEDVLQLPIQRENLSRTRNSRNLDLRSLPPLEEPGLKGNLARLHGVENGILLRRCLSESVEKFHKIEEAESKSLKERMCVCLGWREKEEIESIYDPATLR